MAVAILSQMYRLAEGWGLVPEGCNLCRLAVKFPERKRERFPTDGEFIRLGTVRESATVSPGASRPISWKRAGGRLPVHALCYTCKYRLSNYFSIGFLCSLQPA